MCLSIPGQVVSINEEIAKISVGGSEVEAGIQLLEEVEVGDFVLVHSGFALQVISEEEAEKMLEVIRELDEVADEIHSKELKKPSES
jgi:hydrogenase expression/formation protein HypC